MSHKGHDINSFLDQKSKAKNGQVGDSSAD